MTLDADTTQLGKIPNTVTGTGEMIGSCWCCNATTILNFVKDCQRHDVVKNFARDHQQTKMIQKFLTRGSRTEFDATLERPRFLRRRTDEHKSLPHFSFLLFKVDVVLDFWNLRIPFVVRTHLNLSQQQLVYSSFLFYVTAHCRQQCPSCTSCQEREAQQSQQILFRGFMTPSLMPEGPDL